MDTDRSRRRQAALGLEQLASLVRAQSWRHDGTPRLPPTQSAVLRMLSGADDGLRARRIAERLGVSAASLSDSLRTLETRGWIHRSPDPGDRRAALICLTPRGSRVAGQLEHPERGMGALLDTLDDTDVGALLRIVQLLVLEAQQQGLATGLRTCLGCRYFRPFATGRDDRPHFCAFVEEAFGDAGLRVDCAEQAPAEPALLAGNADRFRQPDPP